MSVSLFMTLATVLSTVTSLITEAIKLDIGNRYSANSIVLLVSAVVGGGGTAVAYRLLNIPLIANNMICIPLMMLTVWLISMLGYDKVMQTIDQIKNIK